MHCIVSGEPGSRGKLNVEIKTPHPHPHFAQFHHRLQYSSVLQPTVVAYRAEALESVGAGCAHHAVGDGDVPPPPAAVCASDYGGVDLLQRVWEGIEVIQQPPARGGALVAPRHPPREQRDELDRSGQVGPPAQLVGISIQNNISGFEFYIGFELSLRGHCFVVWGLAPL